MKNNISQVSPTECYGCRACEQICPHNCITMINDHMGFTIPQINDECILCGRCVKVCPRLQYQEPTVNPKVYALKHKNASIRYKSSSGGAFTAISDAILKAQGFISGCVFNEHNQKVEFILSNSTEERDKMRGSKYVQADTTNIYTQIKNKLEQNVLVLFIGTPCQCEGLKRFLIKDYSNLLIVDILCHSVPSPLILSEAIKKDNHIKNIIMRDKANGWRGSSGMKIQTESNQEILDSTYMNLFYKGLINRPSCSKCQFTKTNRCSDITIGDYWKINKTAPTFEDRLGVSLLIANSIKGKDWFKKIVDDVNYIETKMEDCIQFCMQHPTTPSNTRTKFWADFHKYGYNMVADKYGHYSSWEKFKSGPLASFIRRIGLSKIIRKIRTKL